MDGSCQPVNAATAEHTTITKATKFHRSLDDLLSLLATLMPPLDTDDTLLAFQPPHLHAVGVRQDLSLQLLCWV